MAYQPYPGKVVMSFSIVLRPISLATEVLHVILQISIWNKMEFISTGIPSKNCGSSCRHLLADQTSVW